MFSCLSEICFPEAVPFHSSTQRIPLIECLRFWNVSHHCECVCLHLTSSLLCFVFCFLKKTVSNTASDSCSWAMAIFCSSCLKLSHAGITGLCYQPQFIGCWRGSRVFCMLGKHSINGASCFCLFRVLFLFWDSILLCSPNLPPTCNPSATAWL